jgi:cell division protein FtsB
VTRKRLLTVLVLAGAGLAAAFGGEYGVFDWLQLRHQEREEQMAIARLTIEVDSLKRYAKRLETDKRLLEQIAREKYGMIAKGELMYRFSSDSLDSQ